MYLARLAQKSHRLAILADSLSLQPFLYIKRDMCVCVLVPEHLISEMVLCLQLLSTAKHLSMQLIYLGIILLPSLCYGHF